MESLFPKEYSLQFHNKHANRCVRMDGLVFMKFLDSGLARVAFFDPQYRGVLDKLQYGNEGKERGRERAELPQMTEEVILQFMREIERILLPSGYLFLWVDKFHLIQSVGNWITLFENLQIVDMITWDKKVIGMGYRSRRRSEHLVVIQKMPILAKKTWRIHSIPDVWEEKLTKKKHTHSKPMELQRQLILATTEENDWVLDPASGGYSIMDCCMQEKRNFIGCDIVYGRALPQSTFLAPNISVSNQLVNV